MFIYKQRQTKKNKKRQYQNDNCTTNISFNLFIGRFKVFSFDCGINIKAKYRIKKSIKSWNIATIPNSSGVKRSVRIGINKNGTAEDKMLVARYIDELPISFEINFSPFQCKIIMKNNYDKNLKSTFLSFRAYLY